MIVYLSIFLVLLFCILEYDFRGVRKYRVFFIHIILLAFICISGFSYRLGGDGISYLNEWKYYGDITDLNYSYLMGFNGRMPGWVLLSTLCKTVTVDFWFFHLVHAIIINVAYVRTIKNDTNYVFTGLLFYFALIYFNQNFQILRESLAVSCFFFSLPFFYKKEWLKYYGLVLLAMSFHEAAAFLLFLPLFLLFDFNRRSVIIYLFVGFMIIRFASDILTFFLSIKVEGEIQGKIATYQQGMDSDYKFSNFSNLVLNVLFPLYILYYYTKHNIRVHFSIIIITACLIYILSMIVPIFYRLSNYMLIFNYILIGNYIIDWMKTLKLTFPVRTASMLIVIILFIVFKGRMYLLPYGDSGIPSYVQYYPYSSIFDKTLDNERERMYRTN